MCDFQRENRKHVFTRYIVARRLNARWEYGVLRDEIIQRREVCGNVSMPRNQDWRQNWQKHTHKKKKKQNFVFPPKINQISFIHKTDYGSKQSLNNYR